MKRNLLYLAGFLLAAATIFSGCNDEDPSYHNLVTDTQELIINLMKHHKERFRCFREMATTR